MQLSPEQQAMLDGSKGEAMTKVMKTLVMYGDAFGAQRMVPVTSEYGHTVVSFGLKALVPVYELYDRLLEEGLTSGQKFSADPKPLDRNVPSTLLEDLVFKQFMYKFQDSYEEKLKKLGIMSDDAYTCTCYMEEVGNAPAKGEVLSWAESSAVVYANSVLGARCNRNSGVIELMGSIAGFVPEFGLLTDEGRKATWVVEIRTAKKPEAQLLGSAVGMKVLDALERELAHCEEFVFSVAFVTMSGLIALLPILEELAAKGVPGKVLTTNYLWFSDPEALQRLQAFENIDVRMYWTQSEVGFHTKGYIFRRGDVYRMLIGSANLTANALTKNEEWNIKVVSLTQGEYTYDVIKRFQQLWQDEHTQEFAAFFTDYQALYRQEKARRAAREAPRPTLLPKQNEGPDEVDGEYVAEAAGAAYHTGRTAPALKPNTMQTEFIQSMRDLRAQQAARALLISATGTGKTYAAAFAVRDAKPRRMLFLVHREQIAKQALRSFRRVCGPDASMGLLSGNSKESGAQYVFATMQTMAQEHVLYSFAREAFDFIIIDEVHRAGAASYQRIMEAGAGGGFALPVPLLWHYGYCRL